VKTEPISTNDPKAPTPGLIEDPAGDGFEVSVSAARPPTARSLEPRVWRDRSFLRYLNGFGLSLLGDQIWFVALAWAATQLNNPAQTSFVLAAGSIPRAALILLGGTFVDRWGALRITLISQRLRILIMAVAAGATLALEPHFWLLTGIALAFGAVDSAHMPAAGALPPQLLAREDLPAGQGLVQTLERVATIAGAPVGAFIVVSGGLTLATAVNAVLFSAAFLILRTLQIRPAVRHQDQSDSNVSEGTWSSLRAGLRYVGHDPVLGPILLVVTMLNLTIAAPLNVGVVLLANTHGWQAGGFAMIVAGFGVGATLGALSVVRYRPKRYPAAAGLIWVTAGSLSIAALGSSPTLAIAVGSATALGITSGPASALLLGLVQARTHTAYLGRVMALITFSALGLVPVSFTIFGVLTEATTLTTAFLICAAADLTVALVALSIRPVRLASLGLGTGQRNESRSA
jgi:MFS family permease